MKVLLLLIFATVCFGQEVKNSTCQIDPAHRDRKIFCIEWSHESDEMTVHVRTPVTEALLDRLGEVEGVTLHLQVYRYSIRLYKGKLFTTEEVVAGILRQETGLLLKEAKVKTVPKVRELEDRSPRVVGERPE